MMEKKRVRSTREKTLTEKGKMYEKEKQKAEKKKQTKSSKRSKFGMCHICNKNITSRKLKTECSVCRIEVHKSCSGLGDNDKKPSEYYCLKCIGSAIDASMVFASSFLSSAASQNEDSDTGLSNIHDSKLGQQTNSNSVTPEQNANFIKANVKQIVADYESSTEGDNDDQKLKDTHTCVSYDDKQEDESEELVVISPENEGKLMTEPEKLSVELENQVAENSICTSHETNESGVEDVSENVYDVPKFPRTSAQIEKNRIAALERRKQSEMREHLKELQLQKRSNHSSNIIEM